MLAAPLFESAIHTFRPWLHLDDEHVRGCIVSGTNRLHRKGRATGQSDEGYSNQLLQGVVKEPEQFYIIHYSSQLLYDDDSEGHSPRITSIAVMHFATRQTTSFSVHAVADLLKIGKDEIESRYNDIEKEMLLGFFDFMKERLDKYWIHWRMQNLTYGFEHLEHRSRFLGNPDPPRVPFENRLDLSAILRAKYGREYVPDPKMMNLALQNGPLPQGFLTGEQEAAAFKNKDFIRMHASTLAKVDFFRHIISLAQQGRLRTATRSWGIRVDRLLEGRTAKVVALGAGVVGALVAIYQGWLWLKGIGT